MKREAFRFFDVDRECMGSNDNSSICNFVRSRITYGIIGFALKPFFTLKSALVQKF